MVLPTVQVGHWDSEWSKGLFKRDSELGSKTNVSDQILYISLFTIKHYKSLNGLVTTN